MYDVKKKDNISVVRQTKESHSTKSKRTVQQGRKVGE